MELRVLGPLELWHQGRQWQLGSPKERCVLAVLGASAGEPVSVDTLMDRVWGDQPPPSAAGTMQTYLSRLRGRLKAVASAEMRLERISPRTYRLRIAPEAVDLLRFRRLRGQARVAAKGGDAERAVGLLREAEELWRGEPFGEFAGIWAETLRGRLHEDLRSLRQERVRLELHLGRHADLIGELRELVGENPFAQDSVADLMLALYRCGRSGESLALYRSTRRRLDEELGLPPGPELQQLHQRVLEQDPSLDLPVREPTSGAVVRTSPFPAIAPPASTPPRNSLPRDNRDFTGRHGELQSLLAESDPHGTALPLTVVHGMAGVGKSALVIHAAHVLAAEYPDGLFYVNLRAHSEQPPCEPGEALAVLEDLAGKELSGKRQDSFDARAARWRDWLAHRRALLVFDDAGDAEQVRPLLPGTATCRVFITSRRQLAHMEGAKSVHLEVLSRTEAAALFTRIVGAARISEAATLYRIVGLCGYHPLAIQVTAHRFRHRDSWNLQDILDLLAHSSDLLEEIDIGSKIATAFHLSYSQLDDQTRRLFRCLALHPGPDFTLRAATALAGTDLVQVRRGLEELSDAHLLEEHIRDRHRFHDLLAQFAVRVSRADEPKTARRQAVRRLLACYLAHADAADRRAHPRRRRVDVGRWCLPCDPPPEFADADEATAWLEMERQNLLAAAREAAVSSPEYAAAFLHVLAESFKHWGAWDAAAELHEAIIDVVRAGGDTLTLAQILVERAEILCHQDHEEAHRCATEALALFRGLADRRGEADALFQAGRAELAAGRRSDCMGSLGRALVLYQRTGNRYGEAEALNVQGVALHFAGDLGEALKRFEAVYDIQCDLGDIHGQATALLNAGDVHRLERRYQEARSLFERSLALARRIGVRQQLANLYTNLGDVCRATGRTKEALAYFRRALASYQASRDPRSEANTLQNMGIAYHEAGRSTEAMHHFSMAEEIARRIGNLYERQSALVGIGLIQRTSREYGAALETYCEALRVAEEIEIPLGMANALDGIAQVLLRTQGIEAAREYGERALDLYRRLGVAEEAERVRRLFAR